MTETQKQQRPLPYEWGVGWVAVQNEALTIYTLHPKFKGNTFLVYLYLLKNYNHREGRSFHLMRICRERLEYMRIPSVGVLKRLESSVW